MPGATGDKSRCISLWGSCGKGQRGIAQAEFAAAQLDRHINRSVPMVCRGRIAVQVLVVYISLVGGEAERFPVCRETQHAALLRSGNAKHGEDAVRHIQLAAETRGHGAVVKRQKRIIDRGQRKRAGGDGASKQDQRRAQ